MTYEEFLEEAQKRPLQFEQHGYGLPDVEIHCDYPDYEESEEEFTMWVQEGKWAYKVTYLYNRFEAIGRALLMWKNKMHAYGDPYYALASLGTGDNKERTEYVEREA